LEPNRTTASATILPFHPLGQVMRPHASQQSRPLLASNAALTLLEINIPGIKRHFRVKGTMYRVD
jgi:hypothetical protein